MANILLAALILGPLLLTLVLKSNAALGFLVLCTGFVLNTSVIGDLQHLLSQINLSTTSTTLAIALLIVPLVVTMLLTRRASGKGVKSLIHTLIALCGGGLLALSVVPILGSSLQSDVIGSNFWTNLQKVQSEIIGLGALLSLLLIWLGDIKGHKKH